MHHTVICASAAIRAWAIRDAVRGKGMVALGRVVLAKRERVIALEPYENGLLATTLRYPYKVRDASAYFEGCCRYQGAGRDAQARRAYFRQQGGRLRPFDLRGSLRDRAQAWPCAAPTAAESSS